METDFYIFELAHNKEAREEIGHEEQTELEAIATEFYLYYDFLFIGNININIIPLINNELYLFIVNYEIKEDQPNNSYESNPTHETLISEWKSNALVNIDYFSYWRL